MNVVPLQYPHSRKNVKRQQWSIETYGPYLKKESNGPTQVLSSQEI